MACTASHATQHLLSEMIPQKTAEGNRLTKRHWQSCGIHLFIYTHYAIGRRAGFAHVVVFVV